MHKCQWSKGHGRKDILMTNENFNEIKPVKGDSANVPKAVINRLPRYYRYLRELLAKGIGRISSGDLARMMSVTASQIRQDLNCFGGFGQQGYGYNVEYLFGEISKILGAKEGFTCIIIGAGNLGCALANGSTFVRRGVTPIALFDVSPAVVGTRVAGLPVYHINTLEKFFQSHQVDIAVMTTPKPASAEIGRRLSALKVGAVWNLTGVELNLSPDVVLQNVHLGDSLMTLCYRLRQTRDEID